MTQFQPGDAIANGLRIRYYRSGGTQRPIVLAHGITDSGGCWPRVAPLLAKDYDVITYDARGHGHSEVPREPFTQEDQADDLAGLIRALGLAQPALIGHSMGAGTASFTAARYPELVGCVVLEDPPWRDAPPQPAGPRVNPFVERLARYQSMDRAGLIASGQVRHPRWAAEELEPWADAKLSMSPQTLALMRSLSWSWEGTAQRIVCPALLVIADTQWNNEAGQEGIVTEEIAQKAVHLMRQGRYVHVPNAGHNIRRENFEAYIEAVTAFLAECHR